MAYAILRAQKLKSAVAVHRSMKHAFREQETPNADAERTPDNTHIGAESSREAMAAFRSRLPEKHRKDAVLAVEYLITGSPEAINAKDRTSQDAYFRDALDWLKDKHGAENVVYAGIHRDESTPHMYAYVVPRVGDRLNCRAFLGGAKALSQMQTDFAERVGLPHGLERGLERSKARHTPIRQFYGRVVAAEQKTPAVDVPEPSMGDRLNPRAYGEKVAKSVVAQLKPAWMDIQAKAKAGELARKQAQELRAAVVDQDRRFGPMKEILRAHTPENQVKLVTGMKLMGDQVLKMRAEAAREREAKLQAEREARRGQDKGHSR